MTTLVDIFAYCYAIPCYLELISASFRFPVLGLLFTVVLPLQHIKRKTS